MVHQWVRQVLNRHVGIERDEYQGVSLFDIIKCNCSFTMLTLRKATDHIIEMRMGCVSLISRAHLYSFSRLYVAPLVYSKIIRIHTHTPLNAVLRKFWFKTRS